MKYIYMVTYFSTFSDGQFGFGRQEFALEEPISRDNQLAEMERQISELHKTKAAITSFVLLRTEER